MAATRRALRTLISAAALAFSTPLVCAAAPAAELTDGVYRSGDEPSLNAVQLYIYGGRNYCWYFDAWNGPGYYWCGYAWRHGYGWGGAYGWHGWYGNYGSYHGHYYGHGHGYYGHGHYGHYHGYRHYHGYGYGHGYHHH